jgi:polyisoprenoid-binding protein YceI
MRKKSARQAPPTMNLATLCCSALLLFGPAWAQGAGYGVTGTLSYSASYTLGPWQGKNTTASGQLNWDAGSGRLSGKVCLDLAAWDSGNALRDADTRGKFEVNTYHQSCYTPTRLEGQPGRPVTLIGTLDLHGVQREVRIPGTLTQQGKDFSFTGTFTTSFSDWNLTPPQFLFLSVDDALEVEVSGTASAR